MDIVPKIREKLVNAWIPELYAEKVRGQRTRAYTLEIAEKENSVEVMHTLLGIELKIGNKRFACPDLATARYLQVFARIGCHEFAVPYDITKISVIADEMETAWQKMLLVIEEATKKSTAQSRGRIRSGLLREIRNEIKEIGAGELMPEFRQSTRQRRD